jgi:L,D-transpeptidase YcbB
MEAIIARAPPNGPTPHRTTLPPGAIASANPSSSGPSFFERLFGPPTPPAPVGRQSQRRIFTR